jgi:beta-barrel assembly-enhancing protease
MMRAVQMSCFVRVVAIMLAAAHLSAVTAGPDFPDPGKPRMTREEQRQLGLQAAAQVYQQMPVLPDNSPETQYIRKLGQKLVATIPTRYSWPFEFHVVAQNEINAFALPGGPMFVNVGTITAAGSEAELAGVMAHEISHVYMQHSAKQADKAQWTGLLAGLASVAAGATLGGMAGQAAQMGISMGAQGLSLKYSRTDESQADAVGAIILYYAGYNPQALADFFRTLAAQGGSVPPQLLSDHPNPGNREQAIEKEIQNWPPKNYQTTSAAFQKAKQHALTVKSYTGEEIAAGGKTGQWAALNKKNGAVFSPGSAQLSNTSAPAPASASAAPLPAPTPTAGPIVLSSVLPSQQMVAADLGPIKFSHPENWDIAMPKQQGEFVTVAPAAGRAENGVGYGVLISSAAPPKGEHMSLDAITDALVENMQQENHVKLAGEKQTITVDGIQGRSLALQSVSPFAGGSGQQQVESDWLVTVPQHGGSIIYFIFVAPQSEFSRFRPAFEDILKSVKF